MQDEVQLSLKRERGTRRWKLYNSPAVKTCIYVKVLFRTFFYTKFTAIVDTVHNFLITEPKSFTEKYQTEVFLAQTKPAVQGLYKKYSNVIFLREDRTRKVNKTFIIRH